MENVETLANALKALSDVIRIRLLKLISKQNLRKDICVDDLAKELNISQPNVSHHLKILKISGFIRCEKRDGFSFYILNRDRLDEIASLLKSEKIEDIAD